MPHVCYIKAPDPIPPPPFRGALVQKSIWQLAPNNTLTLITWDVEIYDTDNIHNNVLNPSRLTVPPGVSRVKVFAQGEWQTNSAGHRRISIYKNNNPTLPVIADYRPTSTYAYQSISSPAIPVSPGDYFELKIFQNSGVDLHFPPDPEIAWFGMEIIK